jgi:DNA-binding Xre family transcriptional regulator
MISYDPLWKLLIDRKLKKLDICRLTGIATSTLAKMSKDQYVSLEVLDRICVTLGCSIEDAVKIVHPKEAGE